MVLGPAPGAVVMGTGIVSIGLSLDGERALSVALLVIAAAVWLLAGAGLAAMVIGLGVHALREPRSPGALTAIAATGVLGSRVQMLGWNAVAGALLAIAACLWLLLVPRVLAGWQRRTTGTSFVLAVATESLAVLGAELAGACGAGWLALASLACLALGVAFYVLVVSGFDPRELLAGRGDQWVAGGALAISALACAEIALAAPGLAPIRDAHHALSTAALVLWATAIAWLPPLVACEVVSPRLGYDPRRWSTVFPLGMYAVSSFTVARLRGLGGIHDFARVAIWIAFAVWVLVFAGLVRRAATAMSTRIAG